MDVTDWLMWFLGCLQRAVSQAQDMLAAVLEKARFWEHFAASPMNERQIKVLNRLLDGFDGKLTTSKWAKLAQCSQDLVKWENTTNEAVLNHRSPRRNLEELAGHLCRQLGSSASGRTVQSGQIADNKDHPRAADFNPDPAFAGRRVPAPGDPTIGAGSLRQRPQPGGGADQQGDDRSWPEIMRLASVSDKPRMTDRTFPGF